MQTTMSFISSWTAQCKHVAWPWSGMRWAIDLMSPRALHQWLSGTMTITRQAISKAQKSRQYPRVVTSIVSLAHRLAFSTKDRLSDQLTLTALGPDCNFRISNSVSRVVSCWPSNRSARCWVGWSLGGADWSALPLLSHHAASRILQVVHKCRHRAGNMSTALVQERWVRAKSRQGQDCG